MIGVSIGARSGVRVKVRGVEGWIGVGVRGRA